MSDWQSLIFYITCFSLSALLIHIGSLAKFAKISLPLLGKRRLNIFTVFGLAIPIMIGGFLYEVGIDYGGYINLFNISNTLDYAGFMIYNDFWTVEPSLYVISRIAMFVAGASWPMFMIYSAINVIFFYLFLRRMIPSSRGMAFFIYLTIFFLFTMTLMRQGAAISICFYALSFLVNKEYKRYLLLVGLASLFHFSALFFIVPGLLFFFARSGKPNWLLMITIVMVGLLIVASPSLIQIATSFPPFDKYVYLLDKERGEVFVGYTFILQLGIVTVLSFFYYKISNRFAHASLLYAMLLTGIIAYSLNFRIDYASRLSYFFLPVSTLLIPYLLSVFRNNRLLKLVVILGCLAYFVQVYYIGNSIMVFPYNSIWSF